MSILGFVAKHRITYLRITVAGIALMLAFATMQMSLLKTNLTLSHYLIPTLLGTVIGLLLSTLVALRREIAESQRMYRAVADMAQEFIYVRRIDGSYEYVSPSCEQLTGYPAEDFYAQPNFMDGLVHAEDRPVWDRHVHQMDHHGMPEKLVIRIHTRSGELRWIEHLCSDVRDTQGNITGVRSTNLDITEHVEHEQALSVAAVAFETHEAIVITDRHSRILRVNHAFTDITGYAADEVIGRTPALLSSGLQDKAFYTGMWATLNTLGRWSGELFDRRKNGEIYPKHLTISAVTDDSGEVAHYVGTFSDITVRQQVEKALHDAKEKFQSLVESSSDWIWEVDVNGVYTYASPKVKDLLGYEPDDMIGRTLFDLMPPEEKVRVGRIFEDAIREKKPFSGVENSNLHKDGHLVVLETSGVPVFDKAGALCGYRGVDRDITDRKRYESQIKRQANYDELTGLANRNLFQDRLSQALAYSRRHEGGLAVLFIDLDNFKHINDSLGHDAGDLLLTRVAARLSGSVREGDTVTRQGGDEFVLILSEEGDVQVVTKRILQAMSEPFDINGRELRITCSIGIACYPKDGEDQQTLLKNADAAMYRAKELGRNNAQYYEAGMNTKAMERLELENGLYHALARNEFLLHYQPQVDLRTGEIVGMEALVRWLHPERGMISPAVFIPVAEASGLIVSLGEWVLRTACAQNKAWQLAGLKPISVAVNLSARQFRQPDLVEKVADILRETELDSTYLELELTESLVMQDVEKTIATLSRLKVMGIKLSIDDFGTGYSSLSYLKRFPIDTLKIDQSFVRDITTDPDDAAIAKSIISMAHDMQLRVIAEGVETEDQKCFLRLRRCDEMQGYLFSRPVPAVEFEKILREGRSLPVDDRVTAPGQRTLLLLDDEENILTSLTRLLRRDGYKILKATNAAAALGLLAQNTVGVILSDQRMPEMSGVEFLRRVKRLHPDTVRMVLSGYTDLKSVTDAINEGAVYKFLSKPWNDELLRANIQEAFQHHELARDNLRLGDAMASISEELSRAKRELEMRVEKDTEASPPVGAL